MSKTRRKRCKECDKLFTPKYSTLQNACSPKCAIEYSRKRDAKKKEENIKLLAEVEKQIKEKNSLSTLLKNVSIVCHRYIRERDKNKPCISCQQPYNNRHQAGHYFKAELFSTLKFNEYNIHGQCEGCNLYKEGNESQYRVNLPNRIGLDNYRELERLAALEKQSNHKWDRQELIKIRNYYKRKLKELK